MKILIITVVLILNFTFAFSQCDENLVEKAIKNSGKDALFIRDFKIKNTKKHTSFLSPVMSTEIELISGFVYRFYVENEEIYEATAILQIYEDNMLLGSTYNFETKTYEKSFDFICDETGNFDLIMSFIEPLEGCAVGIMSIVINDSTNFSDIIDKTELSNILYVGIDNFVDIATNNLNADYIDVTINKGTISFENELYKVRVEDEGLVIIKANVKDSLGVIIETFEEEFIAKLLNLPRLTLAKIPGGIISKDKLFFGNPKLELEYFTDDFDFEIIEFTISKYSYSGGIKAVNTNYLTPSQIRIIKELNSGDTFYITNILIKNSNNAIYKLDNVGFIIE